MRIIQFTCHVPQVREGLKALMVQQINVWSRLERLAGDPSQVTQPMTTGIWSTHLDQPDLTWANYDAIYASLGDDGRVIADQMLGDGPMQGILLNAPLMPSVDPAMRLVIVQVDDLVASRYQAAPVYPDLPTEPPLS